MALLFSLLYNIQRWSIFRCKRANSMSALKTHVMLAVRVAYTHESELLLHRLLHFWLRSPVKDKALSSQRMSFVIPAGGGV